MNIESPYFCLVMGYHLVHFQKIRVKEYYTFYFGDKNFIPTTTCTFLELVQFAFGDGRDNKSPQLK
jgi:hypothetical protein